MSYANLKSILKLADEIDLEEGRSAYPRYNALLNEIADRYSITFPKTVAAFAALSPNNDYVGNLRSLISVLDAVQSGRACAGVTVSTYKACRDRAYSYATGEVDFIETVRGPKIRAFYFNILEPADRKHVTVDGHMVGAYRANSGTMKDNIVRRREYLQVAEAVRRLARREGFIPNQLQATIWFARKRLLNVKYDAQMDLFGDPKDRWKTSLRIDDIKPYPTKGILI